MGGAQAISCVEGRVCIQQSTAMRGNVLAATPMKPHEHEDNIMMHVVPESVVFVGCVGTMFATAGLLDKLNLACAHHFAQVTPIVAKPHERLGGCRRAGWINNNGTYSRSENSSLGGSFKWHL